MSFDQTTLIKQQVEQAIKNKYPLIIRGSNSHAFMLPDYGPGYGPEYDGEQIIDMTAHKGIIDYQPTELTIKARAGTPLSEIQQILAEHNQRLPTDFPAYSPTATLGGAIAIGHTGSGRPFLGAIRDHVLGAGLINGAAEILSCGGQVMKNVAGYDISRLICGSRGTLGPVLDISLKVQPIAETQLTRVFETDEIQAIPSMNKLAGRPLPVSAIIYFEQKMYVRLEGAESGVKQACKTLGGDSLPDSAEFWHSIQQQSHDFFNSPRPVWRVIVPASTPELDLEHKQHSLIDWCGGLRWVHVDKITQTDFIHLDNMNGYIENHRGGQITNPADLMTLLQKHMHKKIKRAFDPKNLFNPALSNFD